MSILGNSIGNLINKLGLGFGGNSAERCRIWVDQNMAHACYVTSDSDNTYANGPLLEGNDEGKFEVEDLEVWSFGN